MSSEIGVLFDMDGLLLDTEQVYMDCFTNTQKALGLPVDPSPYMRSIGIAGNTSNAIISTSLSNGISIETFTRTWDELITERLRHAIPVKDGVFELIEHLNSREIPFAVATSSKTETAEKHLDEAGLITHFKAIIGRDKVKNRKPHPEPYLMAADAIARDITNCYAFEDSNTGTRSALASGAKVAQIPDLSQPDDELRSNGHVIASDLMAGAKALGLV